MSIKTVSSRLILYLPENNGEIVARQISLIIGSARCQSFQQYDSSLQGKYGASIIGGVLSGEGYTKIAAFIQANRDWLQPNEVALFGLGDDKATTLTRLSQLASLLGDGVLAVEAIYANENGADMTQLVNAALRIRVKIRERRKKLPAAEVRRLVEAILASEPFLILATGNGKNLRATTIGYTYRNGHVYAFCEGAEKFANILLNNRVALAFYRLPEKDGLQATGTAEIVYPGTGEYRAMCDLLGRDYDRLMSLPFGLNGLDIRLDKTEYYNAELRGGGYESKQEYYFI